MNPARQPEPRAGKKSAHAGRDSAKQPQTKPAADALEGPIGHRHLDGESTSGMVACDVCATPIKRDEAMLESVEGIVAYYCNDACYERREFAAIDQTPEQDEEERGIAPAGP